MDQQKIGLFLKALRNGRNMTQEQAAEQFHVSSRTVSRWENGVNMPDLSILAELAAFYEVSIPEIVEGERKSEKMHEEAKETAVKMAEYGKQEVNVKKGVTIGAMLSIFGLSVIVSALAVFPRDSSWGSIYAVLGGGLLLAGAGMLLKRIVKGFGKRVLCLAGIAVFLAAGFLLTDYVGVVSYHQPPRFCYEREYIAGSWNEKVKEVIIYKTPFYNVIRHNPNDDDESYEIQKR